ncbi:MAG: hypothetical protein MUF86_05145 [Akkermansiaceae bacterium]|jgi:thymidylate kinase|nr:hypothetical protein [Akkermansiaceae bacterium]
MPNGLFIVLEGIDGTGKSTHARRLGEWFESRGREVVISREPTDGPWGKKTPRVRRHRKALASSPLRQRKFP